MIYRCEKCGNDFLTEADSYVVTPTHAGVNLYCSCQIKNKENAMSEPNADDLLVVVQEVIAEYFEWWDSDSTVGPSVHGMMIRLRAAIAKATGEHP